MTQTLQPMRRFEDFEAIMIGLAEEEGWEFRDGDDEVAPHAVFNEETYAPALLYLVQVEIQARGLDIDLGVRYEPRADALCGVAVGFDESAPLMSSLWRLTLAAYMVEQLPQVGHARDLSMLREVFEPAPGPAAGN